MGWMDKIKPNITFGKKGADDPIIGPPIGSYASEDPRAKQAWIDLGKVERTAGVSDATTMVRKILEKSLTATATTVGIPDIGFKGARQQLFQRFNLVDLYAIAHNNSDLKTAISNLKQEVFRRGMRWEPAFEFRCESCGVDYPKKEAEGAHFHCTHCDPVTDETGDSLNRDPFDEDSDKAPKPPRLRAPNPAQRVRFEQIIQKANVYGQSLTRVLQSTEDDLNIADDLFLFLSSEYNLDWKGGEEIITREVKQIFRLDPVFVEFDTDDENRPGFAHHICLAHRENLLTIPRDSGWEHDWKGRCPIDKHTTLPVMFRYSPYRGVFGAHPGGPGPERAALYLVQGEVVHSSKFSPSELYGYSAVLAIYEKVLSLIGMDRYLYDYFFERQVPQGVITTVTDNPQDLETRKEQMLAEVLANPHYIPWLAVSSRSGQGKTEFVRFAYSLDELQFLPVQQRIAQAVAGIYGVPGLFMGFDTGGGGGLNNESQQLTRMSRGAQLSQDVYNTEVFPQLLKAFGITDWELTLTPAEERSEQLEWEIRQRKAQWAATHANMGFGVEYFQDEDRYEITGKIAPKSEQEQGGMFGGFGGGGFGGDDQDPLSPTPDEPEPSSGDTGVPDTGLPSTGGSPTRSVGGQAEV